MPNLVKVLREEIQRLARKELRSQTSVVKKASAQHRRAIAALKREIVAIQRRLALLDKRSPIAVAPATETTGNRSGKRFSAKGLRAQRKRLSLSAGEYGRLVGVTGQAVYNWESGSSRPRRQQIPFIVALRTMGKRQVANQLAKLTSQAKAVRKQKR